MANIEIIEREHLVENSAKVGQHLAEQLAELQTRHKVISDTRGIGLMHSVELKKDPEAGIDFTEEDKIGELMPRLLKEQGLLMRAGASLSIAPPLIINREEIDALVDGIDVAIGNLERELGLV